VALAKTAYDMELTQFACHKSERQDIGCAGFILRGATHNLGARFAFRDGRVGSVTSPYPLHPNYRAMALANGVPPDHPALIPCRDDV
jgi:hypothetical protein